MSDSVVVAPKPVAIPVMLEKGRDGKLIVRLLGEHENKEAA